MAPKWIAFLSFAYFFLNLCASFLDYQFQPGDTDLLENLLGFSVAEITFSGPWAVASAGQKWLTQTLPQWISCDYGVFKGDWLIVRFLLAAPLGAMTAYGAILLFLQAARGFLDGVTRLFNP